MLSLITRQSLHSHKAQIPALLNINLPRFNVHLQSNHHIHSSSTTHHHHYHHVSPHYISHHNFSWTSEQNRRSTAPTPIKTPMQNLKGAEDEYPGEWDEESGTKKQKKRINKETGQEMDDSYLEEEYFGDKSPIHDIQGLIKPKLPNLDKKEPLTPLAEEIKQMIHARGPITFSTFWRMCMQHPKYGYYMTRDPIGREGDFITTPEMFSGFSECLAVWCAFTWESMGRPSKIKIIEYGPGLGTVTKTIMDVIRKSELKPLKDAVSFHLIESSPRLRWKQKTKFGLGNIRKFKMRVKKPIYAVTDVSPYATRNNDANKKRTHEKSQTKQEFVATDGQNEKENEYHQDPSKKKPSLMGLDSDPIDQRSIKSKGVTPLATDPEIKLDPNKRKIRPIVAPKPSDEFQTRDDIPPELLEPTPAKTQTEKTTNILQPGEDVESKKKSNPFKTDRIFGEMSGRAMQASGLSGNMELTDDIKQKYKPFDWSLHHPDIFGHVDEEMKPYVTGDKSKEWDKKHSQIKVHQDPLSAKPETEKQEKTEKTDTGGAAMAGSTILSSSSDAGIKAYNEPLSEYSATSTLPPRKTKRDIESDTKMKETIGFDEDAYKHELDESATANNNNPFQPILDKLEQHELKGGNVGANIDFTDLMDYEDLKHDTAEEIEEIWQARTKDGILVSWHNSLHSVEGGTGVPALILCHEFFDALPISHFEFRAHGWVETVVDVNDNENDLEHFKLIRGPVATFASEVLDRQFAKNGIKPGVGQQFTISPEGNEIMNHIAKYLSTNGGAGFVIDYGDLNSPPWTVQGIKEHKPQNPLSSPGEIDISAHVNFNALSASVNCVNGVKAFGPVTQSYFLQGCGIIDRFRQYVKDEFDSGPNEKKNDPENLKKRKDFFETFGKIMDVDKLGGHFKVMGFCKESMGVPLGFRQPISEKQAKFDEMGIPIQDKFVERQ